MQTGTGNADGTGHSRQLCQVEQVAGMLFHVTEEIRLQFASHLKGDQGKHDAAHQHKTVQFGKLQLEREKSQ